MFLKNDKVEIKLKVERVENFQKSLYDNEKNIFLNPSEYNETDDCTKIVVMNVKMESKEYYILLYVGITTPLFEANIAVLDGYIITVVGDYIVYQIDVSTGSLILEKELDILNASEIYAIENGYIVVGELYIEGVDKDFNEKWYFTPIDVIPAYRKGYFTLENDRFKFYDLSKNFYEIDFNGKLIRD